jgi:hypothetical protein
MAVQELNSNHHDKAFCNESRSIWLAALQADAQPNKPQNELNIMQSLFAQQSLHIPLVR